MRVVQAPIISVHLVAVQCSWCGAIRLRGTFVRFVGMPIVRWVLFWRLGRLLDLRLGMSHGLCPCCGDWRVSHERRISKLETAARAARRSNGSE